MNEEKIERPLFLYQMVKFRVTEGVQMDLSSTDDTNKTYRINYAPESQPAVRDVAFPLPRF